MSKLKCPCGFVIVDQTDNLSYKGSDAISDILVESMDSLSEANKNNRRLEWIKAHFKVPPYPVHLNDSSMIFDLYTSAQLDKTRVIYECESCGRIAIQVGNTDHFKFFSPDTKHTKGILDNKY